MVISAAKTVEDYLDELPADRREVISAVRDVVRKNLPTGYEEAMGWGMINYFVPLSRLSDTYNNQPLMYAALAAQKNHNAIYLMGVYGEGATATRFKEGFANAGKKLDMGKSCVRFQTLDDLPLEVIGETIAAVPMNDYIAFYERSRLQTKAGQKKAGAKKASAKKARAKKATRSRAKPAKKAAKRSRKS